MRKFISLFLVLVLVGCGRPKKSVELIDITKVPVQIVQTKRGVEVEGNFINIDTGELTVKTVDIAECQGWYAVHPSTYRKLLISAQKSKVVIIGPESDPFAIIKPLKDDSEAEICLITLDGDQIVKKVKVAEYRGWIVIHPHMYKRLLETGLKN